MVAILPGITPPYLVRMYQEKEQLDERIKLASAFATGPAFEALDEIAQHLMVTQICAMQAYAAALGARIHHSRNPITPAASTVN